MQTKLQSMIETLISIFIGFLIALLTQWIVFPLFDIQTSVQDDLIIVSIFTAVSIIRGYCIRRFFNWFHSVRRPDEISSR